MKISTIALLVVYASTRFTGKRHTNIFRRTISQPSIDRAAVTVLLYMAVAAAALTVILVLDSNLESHRPTRRVFLETMFEAVSALSTVGLSTGLTTELSNASRCIVILLMFMGRLGPITVFAAVARRQNVDAVEFAHDEPLIG